MIDRQHRLFSTSYLILIALLSVVLYLPVTKVFGQVEASGGSSWKDTGWANVSISSSLDQAGGRGGYIPIEVGLNPAEVPLTVEVTSSSGYGHRQRQQTTSRRIRLEQSRPSEFTIYHPVWGVDKEIEVYVRRQGEERKFHVGTARWNANQRSKQLSVLHIASSSSGEPELLRHVQGTSIKTKNAWSDWRGYTGFDRVLMSFLDLQGMRSSSRRALFRWVANGGHLMLTGSPVDQLRELSTGFLPDPVFRTGNDENVRLARHLFGTMSFYNGELNRSEELETVFSGERSQWGSASWHKRFGWRMHRDANTSPVIPDALLIQSLLEIPVVSGLLILLGFSILIGPVNYWYLRRNQRESLMLLTIPILALLTTGLIFAWDIFKHGLGNAVRARGVVRIDQQENKAAHVTRYMMYMAISPGRLRFPADASVAFLSSRQRSDRVNGYSSRDMEEGSRVDYTMRGKEQILSGTPGQSRTPVFLDRRNSKPFRGRLIAKRTSKNTLKVTNSLGFPVHHLLLVDRKNRYYVSEDDRGRVLETGQSTTFRSVPTGENESTMGLFQRWKKLMGQGTPKGRTGFDFVPSSFRSLPKQVQATRYIGLTDQNQFGEMGVSSFSEDESSYLIQGFHWDSETEKEER